MYMKIVRNTNWKLIGFEENSKYLKSPAFVFSSIQDEDVTLALKVAKYIDVDNNIVIFLNSENELESRICKSWSETRGFATQLVKQLRKVCGF